VETGWEEHLYLRELK